MYFNFYIEQLFVSIKFKLEKRNVYMCMCPFYKLYHVPPRLSVT